MALPLETKFPHFNQLYSK